MKVTARGFAWGSLRAWGCGCGLGRWGWDCVKAPGCGWVGARQKAWEMDSVQDCGRATGMVWGCGLGTESGSASGWEPVNV